MKSQAPRARVCCAAHIVLRGTEFLAEFEYSKYSKAAILRDCLLSVGVSGMLL